MEIIDRTENWDWENELLDESFCMKNVVTKVDKERVIIYEDVLRVMSAIVKKYKVNLGEVIEEAFKEGYASARKDDAYLDEPVDTKPRHEQYQGRIELFKKYGLEKSPF